MQLLRAKWKRGPASDCPGRLLVVATRFTFSRFIYMPLVVWHGMRLREDWACTPGAVGVSVGVDLLQRTTYSVSVWESESAFEAWLRSPYHGAMMRAYRSRVTISRSVRWEADSYAPPEGWRAAIQRLSMER